MRVRVVAWFGCVGCALAWSVVGIGKCPRCPCGDAGGAWGVRDVGLWVHGAVVGECPGYGFHVFVKFGLR